MKHLTSFKLFEKLTQDEVIDLYSYFIRILKIHENHFWKDDKISNDESFKNEINKVFHKLSSDEKVITEVLYNLIVEYEKKLYGENRMAPDESFGCSIWDVCEVIIEDQETLDINRYIQDFSDRDVYVSTDSPYDDEDIQGLINDLDKKLDDSELLEIKDIFQDIADEWDIYWLDEIDWPEVMSGGIDENNFVYSIEKVDRQRYNPKHSYNFLVHLILPENRENPVWKNLDKFISDVENIEKRLRSIGYENVTHHQFNDGEDDKGRHFQVRI